MPAIHSQVAGDTSSGMYDGMNSKINEEVCLSFNHYLELNDPDTLYYFVAF
jgi:hypothetical protein